MYRHDIVERRCCPRCGRYFDINPSQKRKIYCDDCRKAHQLEKIKEYQSNPENRAHLNEKRKERRLKIPIEKRHKHYICRICGEEFQSHTRGKPCYCMSCLLERKDVWPYKGYLERRVGR